MKVLFFVYRVLEVLKQTRHLRKLVCGHEDLSALHCFNGTTGVHVDL